MTSKYNKLKHSLVEQPAMEEPGTVEDYHTINSYKEAMNEYMAHCNSLRAIPCQPGTIWEEDKLYEEGKDYEVSEYSDENRIHQIEVIPIPKEDDLPACGSTVPKWIAQHILLARAAYIKGDYDEVWHQLYSIADPEFSSLTPWKALEEIAKGTYQPSQSEQSFTREQVVAFLVEYKDEYQGEHGIRLATRWLNNKLNTH